MRILQLMSLGVGCTFLLVTWLLLRSADNPELPVTQQTTQNELIFETTPTTTIGYDNNLDSEILRQFLAKYSATNKRSNSEVTEISTTVTRPTTVVTEKIRNIFVYETSMSRWTPSISPSNHLPTTVAVNSKPKVDKVQQQLACPQGLVVTVQDGGRLGNKLFEYAAVWSLARLLNRTAFVPSAILAYLGHVFVNLSVPALESVSHCHLDLGPPLKRYQLTPLSKLKQRYRDQNILLHKWIVLPEPVLRVRQHLREELQFHPRILSQVADTFRGFQRENITYVGVHVRRTDFATFLPREFHTNLVTAKYFHRAMAWFRDKLKGDLLFVVVSDDPEWCQRELVDKDVVLAAQTGSAGASHDLALLASCNHTIIDYGTYGTWGALLAGGHTIALGVDEYFNQVFATDPAWHIWKVE